MDQPSRTELPLVQQLLSLKVERPTPADRRQCRRRTRAGLRLGGPKSLSHLVTAPRPSRLSCAAPPKFRAASAPLIPVPPVITHQPARPFLAQSPSLNQTLTSSYPGTAAFDDKESGGTEMEPEELRKLRTAHGLTPAELAQMLDVSPAGGPPLGGAQRKLSSLRDRTREPPAHPASTRQLPRPPERATANCDRL